MAEAKKAKAEWSGGVLQVRCPHCHRLNGFPDRRAIDVFFCGFCGEPVEVEDSEGRPN